MSNTNTITDTTDIAEELELGPEDEISDLSATVEPEPEKMNFHVQMNGYTMRDFEDLVVRAAAQQLIQGRNFKKQIEEETVKLASEMIDSQLAPIVADLPSTVVMKRGADSITLAEMIGMEGRSYLTQCVDDSGKPTGSGAWDRGKPRLQRIVAKVLRDVFDKEIQAAVVEMRKEVKREVEQRISALVEEEREKISKALGVAISRPC